MAYVSVVIPTYGHRDYVKETLDSVFAQTFTDFELIVVNDGSPDDTATVLRPYVEDGRIRYVEQPNSGQAAARNRGIELARGKYVALLDDDDLWPADKLEWQVAALDASPTLGAVAGVAELVDERGRTLERGQYVAELGYERLFYGNPLMSPGQVLVRTSVLREIGGFDVTIWGADDWQLWFEIARHHTFVMEDRIALRYRFHPGNATKQARRLFEGCRTVLEKQAATLQAAARRRGRRAAYRALYHGWGSRFAGDIKANLKRGRLRPALPSVGGLASLLTGITVEPRLPLWMIRDILPGRLFRWRQRTSDAQQGRET